MKSAKLHITVDITANPRIINAVRESAEEYMRLSKEYDAVGRKNAASYYLGQHDALIRFVEMVEKKSNASRLVLLEEKDAAG